MPIDMGHFAETFLEEAGEHLAEMEAALLTLETSSDDPEVMNTIFRAAHSIKGSSGTFGFDEIARFTHSLENVLDQMRKETTEASPERVDLLLRSSDVPQGLVDSARSGRQAPSEMQSVLDELDAILQCQGEDTADQHFDARPTVSTGPAEYRVVFTPQPDIFHQGMDPLLLVRDLAEMGELSEVEVDQSRLPLLELLDPESCYLSWSLRLRTNQTAKQIREVFMFVEDDSEVDVQAVADNNFRAADPLPTPEEKPTSSPAIKYLIVDDDLAVSRLLDSILSAYGRGHLAFSGAEATGIFRVALEDGQPYDLVCLDMEMPHMDGCQTVAALRKTESDHGITGKTATKVVMVTSSRDSKACIRSFSAGADAYIVKPIDEPELLFRLRELELAGAAK